ncbi:UTP-GlnB uridylyltransferase, GlnD [Gluconacetobacter diazotrophicus PA1 5]|uniref:Bifunctional uridylyltransferase/uridylyl-removing enzyme n=3 Tax=Gluconacetobacter diazotrophicus TaxID=33996 RepID=A9HKC5_GLUDA|nr:[protein-PII] uridylyltransferase [Gluconacetobacter diazotrophicus]ACI50097.1 UTP-GlnB uridylyltransferase, GlnD [Gluconacetobacter diazotrophicus PA1 5]MBB2156209.1 [protein-PII] uridylyltransferase [Gluconacetobacter diazotrophicus]CAP56023.1 putative uridylyltransferase (PII uridylyl transferase) (Uridylyl-removing enzyme) (UTase) [Gluconacetobacter diazotrophicus PA1 5]
MEGRPPSGPTPMQEIDPPAMSTPSSPSQASTPSAVRDLTTSLAASLLSPEDGAAVPREQAIALFRRHLARFQASVREEFEAHRLHGTSAAKQLALHTDGMIRTLVDFTLDHALAGSIGPGARSLAVTATGGYGRGMLAPFSDIDLLFLTTDEPSADVSRVVEYILYFLWDLGLKVGHATRSIAQCIAEAEADTTVRTTLLDARLLAGDASLFAMFEARYIVACVEAGAARFISDKHKERTARHNRFGDSPYLVEPNVKEGRGGLRDLQTLYWMCRYTFGTRHVSDLLAPGFSRLGLLTEQEAKRARRSWDFLWSVRLHLHYISGRAEERLTFDVQPVVGARMGYTRHGRQVGVERFMRHYFLTVREVMRLTHVLEPAVMRQALGPAANAPQADSAMRDAGFTVLDGQILPERGTSFDAEPIQMMRLLEWARTRKLPIHPLAMHQLIRWERRAASLRGDPEAARIFLELLCGTPPERIGRPPHSAEAENAAGEEVPSFHATAQDRRQGNAYWLHILNETGIMGRLMPDWSRIVGQMQFDTYHVFTVDEHTIEAIRIFGRIEHGAMADEIPQAYDLARNLQSRRALYMAILLHDIAKGRGGDHSELGSEIALDVCPEMGLTGEETETVSWLVLHHLLLSHTAFQRDIDDPKTILDLADTIQSPERLRLLLLLTIVDMRAVSPRVWNAWKATLLHELYMRVAEVLEGGLATTERDVRVARAKDAAAEILEDDGFKRADIDHFLGLGYGSYWLSFDQDTHARHAELIREAERHKAPLTVETQPLPARGVTEVTIYTADHPGLFSRMAGALAIAGASIVDARIHTLINGMALDTFWIQDAGGEAFEEPHQLARLSALVEQALSGRVDIPKEIVSAGRMRYGRRMRAIHVPPRVVIDNRASNTYTVIEINGRDRPGLLHDVTQAISDHKLQIASAHITTYGVRAVDVFYVKDLFGLKITDERRLGEIREALLHGLRQAEEAMTSEIGPPAESLIA